MNAVDIAWVAGIFEGEGSIILRGDRRYAVDLVVEMADHDVIARLAEVTGAGSVTGPYRRLRGDKPTWVWKAGTKRDVARLLCAMAPMLGERRRGRALEAAERLSASLRSPRSVRAVASRRAA